ncbi:MAG TPA: aminopeptidase 1 [Synergistaceae bacterium]|nr:aminopeptidase 1 [Synergistaceae bacterium]
MDSPKKQNDEKGKQNSKPRHKAWIRYAEDARLESCASELGIFMSACKTEREAVLWLLEKAGEIGSPLEGDSPAKPGDVLFMPWKNRAFLAAKIGTRPLSEGFRLVGSHLDAPRIDLKVQPLYEDSGLALFDCHYYGGIKKYQWTNIPLALHGEVHLKGGQTLRLAIGEAPEDPVIIIPDIEPHLDRDMEKRKASETILGENLDAIAGHRPLLGEEKDHVKAQILQLLETKWGISEKALVSADLCLVPAGAARSAGLDGSLLTSYGLDDRICAWLSWQAFTSLGTPEYTAVFLGVDKEEIGSDGVAGAQAPLLDIFLSDLFEKTGLPAPSYGALRKSFAAAEALSADVDAGVNPLYKDAYDPRQLPVAGDGIAFLKGSGSRGKYMGSEARGEFLAKILERLDHDEVPWQVASLGKVDKGGGGTIAKYLAHLGMDVLDMGPCLLSMHAPWELVSKADLLACMDAYRAFWKND